MRAGRLSVFVLGMLGAAALSLPASAAAFGPIAAFGSFGPGAGQWEDSGGLVTAADGSAYQADFGEGRVNVFSPEGVFQFAFGKGVDPAGGDVCTASGGCQPGVGNGSAGSLQGPEGIAIDAAGNVYVAESGGDRVSSFTAQGTFRFAFGKDVGAGGGDVCSAVSGCFEALPSPEAGGLDQPRGISIEGVDLYVADSDNERIAVYSTAGAFLYAFGADVGPLGADTCGSGGGCSAGLAGEEAGQMDSPSGVVPVPGDLLAISDEANHRVDVFTAGGEFVRAFAADVDPLGGDVCTGAGGCQAGSAAPGGPAAALAAPRPLASDGEGGVYVGDPGYERVAQFRLGGGFVRAFGAGVLDGAPGFQICTAASGCLAGLEGGPTFAGATSNPYGVAVDCTGAVLVAEEATGFARIERFGEPGAPSCAPPKPPAPMPPTALREPSNQFNVGRLKLNKRAGTGTLLIRVPGPGTVLLKGSGVKRVKRRAARAKVVKLPVRLVGRAQRKLRRQGKAQVKGKVTYIPTGGKPRTKTKKLVLKKKR